MQEIFTKNDLHFAKKRVSFGFIRRNRPKRLPEEVRSDVQKVAGGKFCASDTAERMPPKAAEGFNWIARSCLLCALLRGLQNLEASLKRF